METDRLISDIIKQLKKSRRIILIISLIFFIPAVIYTLTAPKKFTSNAVIFPLSAKSPAPSSSSMISALIGGMDISQSFNDENSVNIVELAKSRTIGEEVAKTRVPEMGNKTIAALLFDDYNKHKGLWQWGGRIPANDSTLVNWAIGEFSNNLNAQITKTNSFQLQYTGRSAEMVRLVSYTFIDKISEFYIELKREKAKSDFEFATSKVDSLRSIMNSKDKQLIQLDDRSLFTDPSKLKYRVPTENIMADKQMIRGQYTNAVANQQSAAYTLQKATPVIKILDRPDPPYKKTGPRLIIVPPLALLAGLILATALLILPVLYRYLKEEIGQLERSGTR